MFFIRGREEQKVWRKNKKGWLRYWFLIVILSCSLKLYLRAKENSTLLLGCLFLSCHLYYSVLPSNISSSRVQDSSMEKKRVLEELAPDSTPD